MFGLATTKSNEVTEDTYFSNFEYEFISHTGGSLFMNKNYFLKDPEKYIKPMQVEENNAEYHG